MIDYICTQCTGRSGDEQVFKVPAHREPQCCPWGCEAVYVKTVQQYLREELAREANTADTSEVDAEGVTSEETVVYSEPVKFRVESHFGESVIVEATSKDEALAMASVNRPEVAERVDE